MKNLFNRLFGGNSEAGDVQAKPTEATDPNLAAVKTMPVRSGRLEPQQIIVGCARSVGMQRDHNEDSLFTLATSIGVDSLSMPFGIFMVADGMGGHQYGEVASETAVRTVSDFLVSKLYSSIFGPRATVPDETINDLLREAMLAGSDAVAKKAPGGGTTMTCVLVMGNRMTIAHVGDSRAYAVYLDGRMQLLTRDHSLVKRLEEMGQITAEEAEIHPQKNVLYRALGQAEPFEPDVSTAPVPQPGYVLLCSDGLWGLVPDDEMFRLIAETANPHRACQALVEAANAAGGHDNITAVLIRMPE